MKKLFVTLFVFSLIFLTAIIQNLYFDNELIKFDIQEIQTITRKNNKIQIGQLSFNKDEE